MNILIADKMSDSVVKELKSLGGRVTLNPDLTADKLPQVLGDAEVLIVRSTKVSKEAILSAKSLNLIIRAGAGVNTIDLDTASSQGIHVANCPGKNADAVAELAMGLVLAADRRIADGTQDLRKGVWNKKLYSKARGLKGRVLGVVGLGSIGKGLAKRAAAFGMEVTAWSRSLTEEKAEELGIAYCSTPLELAKKADVVSVHLAAGKETAHFINAEFLGAMKNGAILVNTSRGEVVDSEALKKAIATKGLKVGLDVYEGEPGAADTVFADSQLAGMITGTHHVGASTDQASEAIASETVRIVSSFISTGTPLNVVNAREKSVAPYTMILRHYNRVGVLAEVFDSLKAAEINIEEMENSIFLGGTAAVCTLKLDAEPSLELLKKMQEKSSVLQAGLKS